MEIFYRKFHYWDYLRTGFAFKLISFHSYGFNMALFFESNKTYRWSLGINSRFNRDGDSRLTYVGLLFFQFIIETY